MGKKALRKDFFMEIKTSFGRFMSIFFIVAIGVAFFRESVPRNRICGTRGMPILMKRSCLISR